jgi:hypothetical protein
MHEDQSCSWRRRAVARSVASLLLSCGLWTFAAGPGGANAIPLICATRDLQIVALIEEHGQRQDVSAERLAIATFVMQIARKACSAGRTEVALAIYDLIHSEIILVAHKR